MNANFGLISTYSNFDRIFHNNQKLFLEISKNFSKFYVISLENIIAPAKGVERSKNLFEVPKNFELMYPKNIDELNTFLKKKKFFCILTLGRKLKYYKIFRILKKNRAVLISINNNAGYGNNFTEKNVTFSQKNLKYFMIKNLSYYIFRILILFRIIPNIDLFFQTNKNAQTKFQKKSKSKLNDLFPFFEFNYYKKIIMVNSKGGLNFENQEIITEEKIVFIDFDLRTKDIIIREGSISIDKEIEYIKKLSIFLKKLKNIFNKNVIICLHPKSNYELYKNYFDDYEIVQFKTTEKIKSAFIVVFHESTAITDALILKKKIIRLHTKLLGNYMENRIKMYDHYKFPTFSIDRNTELNKEDLLTELNNNIDKNFKIFKDEFYLDNEISSEKKIIDYVKNYEKN